MTKQNDLIAYDKNGKKIASVFLFLNPAWAGELISKINASLGGNRQQERQTTQDPAERKYRHNSDLVEELFRQGYSMKEVTSEQFRSLVGAVPKCMCDFYGLFSGNTLIDVTTVSEYIGSERPIIDKEIVAMENLLKQQSK